MKKNNYIIKEKRTKIIAIVLTMSLSILYTIISNQILGEKFGRFDFLIIPISLIIIEILYVKFVNVEREVMGKVSYFPTLISMIFIFLFHNVTKVKTFITISQYYIEYILFFIIIASSMYLRHVSLFNTENQPKTEKSLFNIIYMNYTKSYEIAMLINNKVNQSITIAKEKSFTTKNRISVGKLGGEVSSGYEDLRNEKNSILQEIDVKETKSIILKSIYELLKKKSEAEVNHTGQLILLKNKEIKRINMSDTLTILNVLKDSNFKNQEEDDVEININKMIETIMDDFTIDYTFPTGADNGDEYLIQFPLSKNENFENGYKHNDLQLGKVSVIGIYKGKIDFSKKETLASQMMDIINQSFKNNSPTPESGLYTQMKDSTDNGSIIKGNDTQINVKFEHKELNKSYHLIDVISIIQELEIPEVSN